MKLAFGNEKAPFWAGTFCPHPSWYFTFPLAGNARGGLDFLYFELLCKVPRYR
jgi:hypothetical protein